MSNQTAFIWDQFAQDAGKALAGAENEQTLETALDLIEKALSGQTVPADFWERVAEAYSESARTKLAKAQSAAALNALVLSALARIRARKK
jgi:hypothetical protein